MGIWVAENHFTYPVVGVFLRQVREYHSTKIGKLTDYYIGTADVIVTAGYTETCCDSIVQYLLEKGCYLDTLRGIGYEVLITSMVFKGALLPDSQAERFNCFYH